MSSWPSLPKLIRKPTPQAPFGHESRTPADGPRQGNFEKSSPQLFNDFSWNSWLKPRFSNSRDLDGHSYQARAHETYSRPISWRKREKYLPKWRFPTVPDTYRGFTECSRRFPILPEGLQWCPKVPSLLPRRCMHVKKKLITECRQKIAHRVSAQNWWLVIDDWWLIIDHGWLMIDNWWLMTDDWWLMIDEWWVMIDDWW